MVKSGTSAPEPSDNKPALAIANTLVRRALTMIRKEGSGRNDAGFWLACQLRDNHYPQQTAQKVMQSYIEQVPAENTKGKIEPYTIEEALASLSSAYREQAREAWVVQSPLAGSSGGNGKGMARTAVAQGDNQELPEIILGADQLRDLTNQAIDAVSRIEKLAPSLFMQSSRLVRIGHDEVKRPVVTQMGITEVKEVLTHSANYFRLRKIPNSDGEFAKIPCSPAKEIAEQILARQTQRPYLPFPALQAIVETPVIRPDGSILDQPGYDAATRLYYAPHPQLGQCKVPDHPTREERQAALALIMDTIGDFYYVGEADRANALGLLLTPILRPAIKRHIPLALLDAPKPGTGKGLFADVVSIIATGGSASILTATDNEEEWDKRITAMLIQGRTIISIDNIAGRLQSAKLDAVLTADIHEGRLLGQSTMVKVHNRATWIATGNNIRLGGDLGRRCYRIRFDPHDSRPWLRRDFKHEDLATWVQEHRGVLIEALLTLARAWYADGQPEAAGLPTVGGTFTGWAKTIGSVLTHAGVTGFLSNLEQLYEEADEGNAQWEAFLQTWIERFGSEWITVAELVEAITDRENAAGSCFADILPDALQYALKEKSASFKIRIGKALDKRVDTCYGRENLHLEKTLDKHNKKSLWRVFAGSAGSASPLTRSENPQTIQENEHIYSSGQNHFPHSPQAITGETASSDYTSAANTLFSSQDNEQIAGCDEQLPANNDDREVFEI
ncbi:hypothetical protein KSZ_60530 [Dictyobacter formicarum]|uniref:Uncharacterized protein n=2 Tax=Dictyobacter formicarum TaxID=2778368 RepID=A0ABQ3VP82_9CHLR|nr:hypothetical protein KSZ_60530 [Dictyobacter formicarum]